MIFDNPTNLTAITEVFSTADTFTSGVLGIAIYILIGFGSLFLTSNFNMKESFVSSSFILLVTSLFLKYGLNILGDFFVYLSAILFLVSLIIGNIKSDGA